jgi:membrane protein required for colicin V production
MSIVDILILIPLGYAAWKGFQHGIIIEVFTLLALLVGIYAGIHFSDLTANWMKNSLGWDSEYLPVIAFTITFLGIGAMVYFAGKMIEQFVKVTNLTPVNKVFGVVFAVLKMTYFVSVFLVLVESYDEKGEFLPPTMKEKSLLYKPILKVSTTTIPALKESTLFVKNALQSDSTQLTVDQILRAKAIADSLGIDAEDGKELYEVYQKYEQKNE